MDPTGYKYCEVRKIYGLFMMDLLDELVLAHCASYNEAEVRFHIIDPVMRSLGYPGGPEVYFKLEEKLEYPYFHIGHKSKKDLPLGYPDYRAGLKGARGSFIVEAKAANARLTPSDREQAHSYAAHAQVGANYFVLCDACDFVVYETLSGPDQAPLASLKISEINARFHELENILAPASLAKNCQVTYDAMLKLCDGLPSAVKIRSGEYELAGWAYKLLVAGQDVTEQLRNTVPQIAEMERQLDMLQQEFNLSVSEGSVQRDDEGRIVAEVTFSGVTKNNREAMKILGIQKMMFTTNDKFLSTDPENPTVFESTIDFSLEQGAFIPPMFGEAVPVEAGVDGDIFITARMHLADGQVVGEYSGSTDMWVPMPMMGKLKMEYDVVGPFTLKL
jgi:hypothetical protein